MKSLNAIGLESTVTEKTIEELSILLANYSIFYQNVRGYHWNIQGKEFFELHVKFEELYDDLVLKIDEIAERILTLGGSPEHRYSSYQQASQIKEETNMSNGLEAAQSILASLKSLLIIQREVLSLASENDDEGTTALMSDYIREQEKLVWMYSAYLN